MSEVIGIINAGSSSLKFTFYEGESCLQSGQIDGTGVRAASRARDAAGQPMAGPDVTSVPPTSPGEAVMLLAPWLRHVLGGRAVTALGHRVVHGGPDHVRPERVAPALLEKLAALVSPARGVSRHPEKVGFRFPPLLQSVFQTRASLYRVAP